MLISARPTLVSHIASVGNPSVSILPGHDRKKSTQISSFSRQVSIGRRADPGMAKNAATCKDPAFKALPPSLMTTPETITFNLESAVSPKEIRWGRGDWV